MTDGLVGRNGCNKQAEIVRWVIVWRQCLELYGVVTLIGVQEVVSSEAVLNTKDVYLGDTELRCQRKEATTFWTKV